MCKKVQKVAIFSAKQIKIEKKKCLKIQKKIKNVNYVRAGIGEFPKKIAKQIAKHAIAKQIANTSTS